MRKSPSPRGRAAIGSHACPSTTPPPSRCFPGQGHPGRQPDDTNVLHTLTLIAPGPLPPPPGAPDPPATTRRECGGIGGGGGGGVGWGGGGFGGGWWGGRGGGGVGVGSPGRRGGRRPGAR